MTWMGAQVSTGGKCSVFSRRRQYDGLREPPALGPSEQRSHRARRAATSHSRPKSGLAAAHEYPATTAALNHRKHPAEQDRALPPRTWSFQPSCSPVVGRPREKLTSVGEMLAALDRKQVSEAKQKILLPTDFSRSADQALLYALSLSNQYDAELHMLHVSVFHEEHSPRPPVQFPDQDEIHARLAALSGVGAEQKDPEEFDRLRPDEDVN